MNKIKTNFVIDAIMFLCLMTLAGTGFLRRYTLPGGGYGRGYGALGRSKVAVLGLDGHAWSNIHLWLGCLFLLLVFIHIALHWKEIKGIYHRTVSNRRL